jgi:hypothetical protein
MHTRASTAASLQTSASQRLLSAALLILNRASIRSILRQLAVLLFPVGQLAALLWVIWTRTAQVPFWDEWNTVDLVRRWRAGALTFGDLWTPHVDAHRVIVPRLIDLLLIQTTAWNRQVEMTVDLALAIVSGGLILWCARRTLGPRLWPWLVPPLGLLLFGFAQFANWYAPFQIAFIATVCGVCICVAALGQEQAIGYRNRAIRLGIAFCGALLASLSSLNGLVAWPAFLPAVWATGRSRTERWRRAILWAVGGALVWIAYFVGFPRAQTSLVQPGMPALDLVRELSRYALVYLGAPLGFPTVLGAAIWGIVGVCFTLVVLRLAWLARAEISGLFSWIGLLLFAVGCLIATTAGRAGNGPYQALFSRYQAFSSLWWVALLVLGAAGLRAVWVHLLAWRQQHRMAGSIPIALGALLLVAAYTSLGWANMVGWQDGLAWQDAQQKYQGWIALAPTAPERCLLVYHPLPGYLIPRIAYLKSQRLALFVDVRNVSATSLRAHLPDLSCLSPYPEFISR